MAPLAVIVVLLDAGDCAVGTPAGACQLTAEHTREWRCTHLIAGLLVQLECPADVAAARAGGQQAAVGDGGRGQALAPHTVQQVERKLQGV